MLKRKGVVILSMVGLFTGLVMLSANNDSDGGEGSGGSSSVSSRSSQTRTLSPRAMQSARRVLAVLPPDIQGLWQNSVQALGPVRAEEFLAMQDGKSIEQLQAEVQFVERVLGSFPLQSRQRLMNGFVGVSNDDEKFVAKVLQEMIDENQAISCLAAGIHQGNQESGAMWSCILGGDNCIFVHVHPYPS